VGETGLATQNSLLLLSNCWRPQPGTGKQALLAQREEGSRQCAEAIRRGQGGQSNGKSLNRVHKVTSKNTGGRREDNFQS